MATAAAVLSVQVKAEGVAETARKVRDLDADLDKAGTTGSKTGSALKKVGAVVGGLVAFDTLRRGVGAAVGEFEEARKVGALTESVIKSTGGAANVTAGQVADLAGAISKKTGIDDEAIQSGANLLLTFKNVRNETGKGRDIFNQATAAAVDLSAAGFGSLESTSKQLGKALNDPVKGMTALGRSGVTFSEDQKKAIAALMATGKAADRVRAQQIVLREVQSQVGGSAAAQATSLDHLKVTLGNLAEAAGSVLVPMLDKGAKFLAGLINQMIEGRSVGGAIVSVFRTTGTVVGTMITAIAGLVGWFRQHETVSLALGAALGVVLTAFVGFKILAAVQAAIIAVRGAMLLLNASLLANPIALVVLAIAALVAGLVVAYRESETFRAIVQGAWEVLKIAAETIFPIIVAVIGGAWDVIRTVTTTVWGLIKGIVEGVWTVIRTLATTYFEAYKAIATGAWDAIRTATTTVWGLIKGIVEGVWTVIRTLATTYFEAYRTIATGAWNAIRTATNTVWDGIKSALDLVWGAIKTAADTAWDLIRSAVVNPVRTAATALTGDGGVLPTLKGAIGGVWDAIKTAAGTAWDLIRSAVLDPIRDAREKALEVARDLRDKLGDVWEKVKSGVNTLKEGFTGAFEKIGGAIDDVIGFFDSVIDRVKDLTDLLKPLKDAAGFLGSLPGKLPGVGGRGNGSTVGPIPTGVAGGVDMFRALSLSLGLSGGLGPRQGNRPGDDGWHGQNRARDHSGSAGAMMRFARILLGFAPSLLELIYTPLGVGVKNGQVVPISFFGSDVMADHYDHVHVAMEKGGFVKRAGWALVGERGPELAHFPGGASVYSNQDSQQMFGAGAGVHVHGDLVVNNRLDADRLAHRLAFRVATEAR